MKKILFILLMIPCLTFGQRIHRLDISEVAGDDTTIYLPARNTGFVQIDFSSLSADTDSLDLGMSYDAKGYVSVGEITGGATFPVTLDKDAINTTTNGVTRSRIAATIDKWNATYIVIKYYKVGSETGIIEVLY